MGAIVIDERRVVIAVVIRGRLITHFLTLFRQKKLTVPLLFGSSVRVAGSVRFAVVVILVITRVVRTASSLVLI